MNFRSKRKLYLIVSGVFFALGLFFIFQTYQGNIFSVKAEENYSNVRGWIWSENVGWISANCYNDFTGNGVFENCCPGGDTESCPFVLPEVLPEKGDYKYGIDYTTNNKLTGWGWSENVGWICFGETCQEVCLGGTSNGQPCTNDDNCSPGGVCGGQPPHGLPFSWACVGQSGWTCEGGTNDEEFCYFNEDCPGGSCLFSCTADSEEDINDSGVCTASVHLKSHWKMNTGSITEDSSNNSNVLQLLPQGEEPGECKGKFGGALEFNGYNHIEVADSESLSVTGNLTVEAWIKRGELGTEQTILGKWDEAGDKSYRLWFSAGVDNLNSLNFSVSDGTTVATATQKEGICVGSDRKVCGGEPYDDLQEKPLCSDFSIEDPCPGGYCREPLCSDGCDELNEICRNAPIDDTNKWHHVVGKYIADNPLTTINEKDLQLFIDGTFVYSRTEGEIPDNLNNGSESLYIGGKNNLGTIDTNFVGRIDNISIWSCQNEDRILGRNTKEIWNDAKKEIDGWARVVSLGERGWLKLKGFTQDGRIWGTSLKDYSSFYVMDGYMANRWVDESAITNGLVAHWKMNKAYWGGLSGEVIDSSGNNHHGTRLGGLKTDSKGGLFNNAGDFYGEDGYISISDIGQSNFSQYTISAWVKPKTLSGLQGIYNGGSSGHDRIILIDNNIYLQMETSGGWGDWSSSKNLVPDKWYHIVVVNNPGNYSLYINGTKDETATSTDSNELTPAPGDLDIGRVFWNGEWHHFNGYMDNFSIYNRVLDEDEITSLFQKRIPHCTGWAGEHDYSDPPAPLDFNNLRANNDLGCDTLVLYWDPADWAEDYTYYRCDNQVEGDCNICSYTEYNVLDGACNLSECSLENYDLSPNTGYCYKVEAHNETGDTFNSEGPIWVSTLLCSPENGEIDDSICGQIDFDWETVSEADGYNVYRSFEENGCDNISNAGCQLIAHYGEAMDYDADNDGTDDLVAYWKMNETDWSTEDVYDSSGNANHGTAVCGGTCISTSGIFDSAGYLAGDDYVDVGNIEAHNNSNYVIEFWIKGGAQAGSYFYSEFNTSLAEPFFGIGSGVSNSSSARVVIRDDDGNEVLDVESGNALLDDSWHHFAWVDENGEYTLYIDGKEDQSDSYNKTEKTFDQANIGRHNSNSVPGGYYIGYLDNFSINSVVKSEDQIIVDYEAGISDYCEEDEYETYRYCGVDTVCTTDCGDGAVCCSYSDFRVIPFVDYYYVVTATNRKGESVPGPPDALSGKTICFPPPEEEEQ